jgi:AcrR family transcriptional regulator
MLIHHFGSRDGLMAAIVESVERDQNERLGELPEDAAEAIRSTWKRTSVRSLWPIERLFFECYARGAQGEPPFDRLVPALVERTLEAVSTRPDVGVDEEGRAGARLGLAVIRGLLLDLVATGDRKATDRALELYASMVADRSAARRVSSKTAANRTRAVTRKKR